MIKAECLTKDYTIRMKKSGLKGMAQSLFHSKAKIIRGVRDVSFSIKSGELVG